MAKQHGDEPAACPVAGLVPDAAPLARVEAGVVLTAMLETGLVRAGKLAAAPAAVLAITCLVVFAGVARLCLPRAATRGRVVFLVAWVGLCLLELPETANHHWLVLVILLAFCLAPTSAGPLALRRFLRVLASSVLIWSGVQKLLWGAYDRGELLTLMYATDVRFSRAFGWMVPGWETEALRALGPPSDGAGPFVARGLPLLGLSWLTVVAELACGLMLWSRRASGMAVIAGLALVSAIELGAREWYFGCVMLCLLYACGGRAGKTAAATIALFVVMMAAALAQSLARIGAR
jgi:hypothetical protein